MCRLGYTLDPACAGVRGGTCPSPLVSCRGMAGALVV